MSSNTNVRAHMQHSCCVWIENTLQFTMRKLNKLMCILRT